MNAVITYIFGENTEILREPLVVDPDVEYICVTDQPNLQSGHWHIIIDNISNANCIRDKMPMVKYNPFKYTHASKIIVMDGAFQLTTSLMNLFHQLDTAPLLIKSHHMRNTLSTELIAWTKSRKMDPTIIDKFNAMSFVDNISLDNAFLVGSGMICYRNTKIIHQLCDLVLLYMQFLGADGNLCITNQCPLTYILEKFNIPYEWFDWNQVATLYKHNSWEIR